MLSDLDSKEIVAKKVGKFSHCKFKKGDILSQVEAFRSFLQYCPFLLFSNAIISQSKGKMSLSQFVTASGNGQDINLSK